jgi:hypothetical protein
MDNFRQKTNEDWTSNDYYNRYIETKQFYNFPARIYKRYEYAEIKDRLNRIAEHFNYILNKLQPEYKQEFISYYKSDLTSLRNKQTQLEFIELINNFIQDIDVTPQQVESVKPDEVKKELHNHIFKGNAFEVWQSMFDEFEINESSRTDVKFMFEEMRKNGLIHNTVNQKVFLEWISTAYNGLIVEKTSNHSRTQTRINAFERAKKLYKE